MSHRPCITDLYGWRTLKKLVTVNRAFKHSWPVKPHNFGHVHRCKFLVQVSWPCVTPWEMSTSLVFRKVGTPFTFTLFSHAGNFCNVTVLFCLWIFCQLNSRIMSRKTRTSTQVNWTELGSQQHYSLGATLSVTHNNNCYRNRNRIGMRASFSVGEWVISARRMFPQRPKCCSSILTK